MTNDNKIGYTVLGSIAAVSTGAILCVPFVGFTPLICVGLGLAGAAYGADFVIPDHKKYELFPKDKTDKTK